MHLKLRTIDAHNCPSRRSIGVKNNTITFIQDTGITFPYLTPDAWLPKWTNLFQFGLVTPKIVSGITQDSARKHLAGFYYAEWTGIDAIDRLDGHYRPYALGL